MPVHDWWFWLFWALVVYRIVHTIWGWETDRRDLEQLRRNIEHLSVTDETMALTELRLVTRRLIIDPTDQSNWNEVRKLLVGTDFEVR